MKSAIWLNKTKSSSGHPDAYVYEPVKPNCLFITYAFGCVFRINRTNPNWMPENGVLTKSNRVPDVISAVFLYIIHFGRASTPDTIDSLRQTALLSPFGKPICITFMSHSNQPPGWRTDGGGIFTTLDRPATST
uniref:Uncharacterized protein n=1 Tax=Picea glauca TaxID=3330 RepID=A0A101M0C8_PICGL|nr:hypothetical protein ABT39_MTgene4617 [Picea glauca]QHR92499.1 hypothetical protein Q903MT_gene6545 [Picea sitchensis]